MARDGGSRSTSPTNARSHTTTRQGDHLLGPGFPSATGTREDRNRVRSRIDQDRERTARGGRVAPLPEGLTLHPPRRMFASVVVALGRDPRYVMTPLGHSNPTMTLGIYARVMDAASRTASACAYSSKGIGWNMRGQRRPTCRRWASQPPRSSPRREERGAPESRLGAA